MEPNVETDLPPVEFSGGTFAVESTSEDAVNLPDGTLLYRLAIGGRIDSGDGSITPKSLQIFNSLGSLRGFQSTITKAIYHLLNAQDYFGRLDSDKKMIVERGYDEAIAAGGTLTGDVFHCSPYLRNQRLSEQFRSASESTS